MAKARLTKEAIQFIIDTYDCKTANHTFSEIVDLIAEKFKISVSLESVRKSYHKNSLINYSAKDKPSDKLPLNKEADKPKKVKEINFTRKLTEKPKSTGFDDSAPSNEEMKALLKPEG